MAVLFLRKLHDSPITKPAEERFGLLISGEFDGSDFGFLNFFARLFTEGGLLADGLGRQSERLEFEEFHRAILFRMGISFVFIKFNLTYWMRY